MFCPFHCVNEMSPRQIPVYVLMSLASNYPWMLASIALMLAVLAVPEPRFNV